MRKAPWVAIAAAVLLGAPAGARATAGVERAPGSALAADGAARAQPVLRAAPLYDTNDSGGTSRIFTSALYGGLAGALVGGGIALIENGNYGRDIAIGAGAGILIGAVLGATRAFGDSRPFPMTDGLTTTERFPVLQARTIRAGGRF